jgi:fibronectin type 3 domain-containing protein
MLTVSTRALLLGILVLLTIGFAGFREESKGHSVTITWKATPSTRDATVVGYNVYRRANSTTPYEKISTKVNSTTYEDHQVKSGTTYFYVVTSIDQRWRESSYSTMITAKVP